MKNYSTKILLLAVTALFILSSCRATYRVHREPREKVIVTP
ncbi:MAG: hypothetical protein ACR2FN_08205 [Chitinophagaceae bacterium]